MINPNNKSFQASLSVEEEAWNYIKPYYENLYGVGFVDVRGDKRYQDRDIDFLLNGLTVELKALSRVYNGVFLFELKKGSDEYETEYNGAFLTSQADSWLITDNENKVGWYFRLRDLKALVYKLIADKTKENTIRRLKKNYEKDRPQLYKKILLVKQDYILQNCSNQIINFI